MLGYCLHGLCAFPNIVIPKNIARKSEKREEKNRHDVDYYWQCCGSAYMVCAHITNMESDAILNEKSQ